MGNRIHIQTKHEIEYGESGFNWQIDELKRLLEDSGCSINDSLNEDAVGDWEISEDQFREAINDIETKSAEEIRSYFDSDYVGLSTDEEFKDEVISILRRFEKTGDHKNGFYHFTWF